MAAIVRRFFSLALQDLANQYALPVKSMTGSVLTRVNARKTRYLERAAVEAIGIGPDDNVLEIGYGRGDGIGFAYEKVRTGNGIVFGIDRSSYMEDVVRKRFCIEIAEDARIRLDQAKDLSNLPYPSDFFAGVFHVDSYYFWGSHMRDVCWDLCRVLKPGGILVCAMQLSRLRKLEEWNLLSARLYNPMRYLQVLEPVGFVDVKMGYHKGPRNTEFQLIKARKPIASSDYFDPDVRMKQLEMDIKREFLAMRLLKEQRPIHDSFEADEEERSNRPK